MIHIFAHLEPCGKYAKMCTAQKFLRLQYILYGLLPTGSEEIEVLRVGSIPVAILFSCQDMKTIAIYLHKQEYSWVVKKGNTPEAVLRPQYTLRALVSMIAYKNIVALILPPLCFLF